MVVVCRNIGGHVLDVGLNVCLSPSLHKFLIVAIIKGIYGCRQKHERFHIYRHIVYRFLMLTKQRMI